MEGARNYRAVIQYDGTGYEGFQIQARRPTIQGEIEAALERLTQSAVRVHGAGRTDSGVHAWGQVVSFRTDWRHGERGLQRALNAVLPTAISVRQLSLADEGFHARFSALRRAYAYSVYQSDARRPLLDRYCLHIAEALDLDALNAAAAVMVGEQDQAAFGQSPGGGSTIRRVYRALWLVLSAEAGFPEEADALRRYRFEIEADGFLRGMVRRIVGTLLPVGMGRMTVREVADILASRDISRAAPPAPARGLCLMRVAYADDARAGSA